MSVIHDSGEFKHSLMALMVFIPDILFFFANADNVNRKQSEPVDFTFSFFLLSGFLS